METFRPLTGRSWVWGGGVLFPGLQGSGILEQLSEVMVGLLPSSPLGHIGEHLKLEGFIEVGSGPV